MEKMTIHVRHVEMPDGAGTVTARVWVVSQERYRGRPRVEFNISVRLPEVEGEPMQRTRRRARDEVLRFLDIA